MNFKATEDLMTIHGRTLFLGEIRYINYSLSGVEMEFTGKKLEAVLTSDYPNINNEIFKPFCAVIVNGEMTKRFDLLEAEATYELFSSEETQTVKIELVKMSEAAFGKVGIKEFISDSDVPPKPVAAKPLKLEFVGDSITCGYGIEGVVNVDTFNTTQENPYKAYAAQTARRLNADFNLISWSGIGVLSSWVPDDAEKPLDNWLSPMIYPYTDAGYSNDLKQDPFEAWDFNRFVPDCIIVNLGTNDQSWTKDIPERKKEFTRLYVDYIRLIRSKNPKSKIVCTLGAMNDGLCKSVGEAVQILRMDYNDDDIYFLAYKTHTEADGMGADFHPSQKTHDRMADELTTLLKKIL